MATQVLYRMGIVCSIFAFVLMFIAFASPYWYKSWTRVHSAFGNIGLWHVCLSGYTMPRDPLMKSYVGCWWIHSTEFEQVVHKIMPAWFRIIQMLCVFTLLLDLVAMVLTLLYLLDDMRQKLYAKNSMMFIINAILLLISAFLVFLIALIFGEMTESEWMPRPWMNYLSWSYGLCVISGFFAAFGGMALFILGLVNKDKENQELDNLDSAAELRRHNERAMEKEREATGSAQEMFTQPPSRQTHVPATRFTPSELTYRPPPPTAAKPQPRPGESFV